MQSEATQQRSSTTLNFTLQKILYNALFENAIITVARGLIVEGPPLTVDVRKFIKIPILGAA